VDICVIINPQAGSVGDEATLRALLGERLPAATLHTTTEAGGATELARRAIEEGCRCVVAAGGDGTINQVIAAMAPAFDRASLALLPLGTGNDLARSIGVPLDLDGALDVLCAGSTRKLDIMRVSAAETHYCINVSAGGFSGAVDEQLSDEMKRSWGPLAYLRAALAALPDLTDYWTTVVCDDEPPLRISLYSLVVANGRFVAGGIPIAPQAVLDDGLLDLLIVPAASLSQLALLVPQILRGQHITSEQLIVRRVRKLAVESHPPMWCNVDGELIGNEPVSFEVLPQAINVVVGENF
jgi:diacylglycerol kinase (ATP)